jgi:hypothetical protein
MAHDSSQNGIRSRRPAKPNQTAGSALRKPSNTTGEAFGSYERWREAKDGIFLPRIQGVMDFLLPHAESNPDLADWMTSHEKILDRSLRAVASIYADDAVALEKKIISHDWGWPTMRGHGPAP